MINYNHGVAFDASTFQDKEKFFEWRNDKRIWQWCRQNTLVTEKQHNEYWYNVENSDDKKFFSVIKPMDRRTLYGCAGLTSIDRTNLRAEFSLYIGPEHQGNGLGKAALQTLLDHAFLDLNLNLIWGETFDGNPAMHMFQNLGFVKEGTRRHFYFRNGKYIDCHLVSMMRSEWELSRLHWV